jgi:hypothetical protein
MASPRRHPAASHRRPAHLGRGCRGVLRFLLQEDRHQHGCQPPLFHRQAAGRPHGGQRLQLVPGISLAGQVPAGRRGNAGADQRDDGQRDLFLPRGLPVRLPHPAHAGRDCRSQGSAPRPHPHLVDPLLDGEEPYSIAISILEDWPRASDFDIEIIASDIDTRALARAREGIYQARALHRVSPRIRDTYFRKLDGENWQVVPTLRESIDFGVINVSSPTQMARMRGIDVIFCRNLLIYFDDLSRRQTAEHFFDALNPGGFVALGHSESMSRISNIFVPRKFPEALVHQRPLP